MRRAESTARELDFLRRLLPPDSARTAIGSDSKTDVSRYARHDGWWYETSSGEKLDLSVCPGVDSEFTRCVKGHDVVAVLTEYHPPGAYWSIQWIVAGICLTVAAPWPPSTTELRRPMALTPPRARAADTTTATNTAAGPAAPRTSDARTARPGSAFAGRPRRSHRARPYALVLLLVVLTLATGLWGLEREHSMWRDESTTYQVAHRGLGALVRMLGTVDVVHGLYYLLMYAVYGRWEGGLWALRLPSVLAMAGAAAGVALVGRRLGCPRAGLAAGLVFPLLPPVQRYAQEGRSYALVCACVVWGTYLLLRAVAGSARRAWWAYAAVMALACLLHEFAVLALLAHGLTLRRARVRGDAFWSWARAAASAAVPLAPLVVVSQQQVRQVAWISAPGLGQVATFLGLALAALALARVAGERRGRVGLPALALPLFVVPMALLMAASALHPIYVDRTCSTAGSGSPCCSAPRSTGRSAPPEPAARPPSACCAAPSRRCSPCRCRTR